MQVSAGWLQNLIKDSPSIIIFIVQALNKGGYHPLLSLLSHLKDTWSHSLMGGNKKGGGGEGRGGVLNLVLELIIDSDATMHALV